MPSNRWQIKKMNPVDCVMLGQQQGMPKTLKRVGSKKII